MRSAPVARGSCLLAAPSLTAGITASRVSSRDLAMGPVSGPRSSRGAGRHVTAQRWRQQAACQRSPRASARLARTPPRACQRRGDTPARRLPRTAPARPHRRPPAPIAPIAPGVSRRTTCGVRSSPRHLSHSGRAPERSRRPTPGCYPEAHLSPRGAPSGFQPLAGRPSENRTPQEGYGGGVSRHAPRQNHRPGGQGRVVAPVACSLP
jgi:hypothetical protein